MRFVLIRHGKTEGNLTHSYIGCRTDEPLCGAGIEELRKKEYPPVDSVVMSPMLRCRQTAEILYPGKTCVVEDDLKECDFGLFEGLNYAKLNGREDYQRWIDSGGELPFPEGESKAEFSLRSLRAFEKIREQVSGDTVALVVHGGTIMAIMEKYARPQGSYYDFQIKNGEGYILYENGSYECI